MGKVVGCGAAVLIVVVTDKCGAMDQCALHIGYTINTTLVLLRLVYSLITCAGTGLA